MELVLSVVKSTWCASVSALPFEVRFIPLAQGGAQMLGCMQSRGREREREKTRGDKPLTLAPRLVLGVIKPGISVRIYQKY